MSVSKITRVPLREVWAHEAFDFTTWLEQNVDVLNEVLDFNLVSAEREKAAGDFSVDLVGEDENGNTVIVENQLEKSDHDHLGKVLTYLAAMDAKAAVWIVGRARPEHTQAVAWLNESTAADFYLIQLEAIRIGNSPAAPLFTRIVGPSPESRAVGARKRELNALGRRRQGFWAQLLERAARRTPLFRDVEPTHKYWIQASAGRPGVQWDIYARTGNTGVDLYIARPDPAESRAIFDRIAAERESIEAAFGGPLTWERREGRSSCRVGHDLALGGLDEEQRWPEIIDATVDAMARLERAIRDPLERAVVEVVGR